MITLSNIYFIIKNNKNMKKFCQICLFLSSFSPLFILILLKELIEILNGNWSFNVLNTVLMFALLVMFFAGVFSLLLTIKKFGNQVGKEISILEKQNITDQNFLGYFSIFVLFALSFEIELCSMAFIFFAILLLIGIVYIRNDIYYINPLINILGFSFYDLTIIIDGKKQKIRAFCKGRIDCNKKYLMFDKYNNFIFIKERW